MHYRFLGESALQVSPLCLGAMMFGGQTDTGTALRIIARAAEQGINFIDTADIYHAGRSEDVVGQGIAENREHWVLASKFGFAATPAAEPNQCGQSRKWIVQSVEASLKRLKTDYIDIMYFHRALPGAPLEEGIRALGDLIAQGKLRYYGVSNFHGWRIAEVVRLADQLGLPRPIASQPLYNLVSRGAEVEQLPAAAHYGLGAVCYSPLARGVLTGKYAPDSAPPADSRAARGDVRMHQAEWRAESLPVAQAIAAHAAARGTTPVAFALAWVLHNRLVSATIAGPRTEEQWDGYLAALDVQLDEADERLVDALVAPGHSSTPGHTDPAYPVEGRRTG